MTNRYRLIAVSFLCLAALWMAADHYVVLIGHRTGLIRSNYSSMLKPHPLISFR